MATRLGLTNGQHTAGIYSDMTVDGPEIGTLVVVVDRAKNLPNRRTLGKQDPYCAARLGKEAKKTETDLRGGQTPRWDQELRFTVHDSPDYHNIKVSVFNDDKKTDLIGEAWVQLWDIVITPGGGRADNWHHLSYRGKYAGEVRLEMSYYDSRVPEKPATPSGSTKRKSPVKRRPLPAGPSPTVIPQFGPRTMGCSRGTTVYLDDEGHPTAPPPEPTEQYTEHDQSAYNTMQPDFLPQIPPRQRHRTSDAYTRDYTPPSAPSVSEHSHAHGPLGHSHSTPNFHAHPDNRDQVYTYEGYDYKPEHGEYDSNGRYELDGGEWDSGSAAATQYDHQQPSWEHDSQFDHAELPPLPPSHSGTPQHERHRSYDHQSVVSSTSPLQSLERTYAASSAGSSRPVSEYYTPARNQNNPSRLRHEVANGKPHGHSPSGTTSPFSRSVGSSPAAPPQHSYLPHPGINRQSVSDPYMTTPPRAHPLSQVVPRPTSPQPYQGNQGYEEPSNYHFPEDLTVARPQPVSQSPRARHSIAAIRQPVSSHASSPGESRLGFAPSERVTPTRKEVGSRPTPPGSERSSVPFSPDSFDTYNPAARASHLDAQPSPHSPYHIPAEPTRAASSKDTNKTERDPSKPIVGFDGRVIDPSDHLPVDSWAPEPEVKTPTKSYAGSSHSFGPRAGAASGPRKSNIVVNVRTRDRMGLDASSPTLASSPAATSPTSPGRNRLMKKSSPVRNSPAPPSPSVLREIDVPNPYASSARGSPFGKSSSMSSFHGHGGYMADNASEYGGSQPLALPPPKPPKIPLGSAEDGDRHDAYGYGPSALSREISKIDIGGSRRPPRGAAVGMRYS
ncbi:hypothetical protein K461DRAFT_228683 [Myriangium duriaei CBS 260.36]|uniref:C2 domain-containing protein n=1 Tax=Myriangium duriaei CBS 260.36 TaxID=1168546 RepID=A0A9P4MFR6_9PEZI|nr:hypothetical protein K461DRAFT_228683 [Myriangium duriaei CBS 260.36]